jgi:hypothetical protein
MSGPTPTCEHTQELAAEVALGIAAGDERAAVLRHTTTCRTCRRLLDSLSATVQILTIAVPPVEPPDGFDTAVLARMVADTAEARPADGPADHRSRAGWRRRALRGVAAVAAAGVLFVAGLALGRVTGESGRAGQLLDATPTTVGEVVAGWTTAAPTTPEPWPSWMTVFVYPGAPPGEYRVRCTYEEHGDVDDWEAGALTVTAGKGTSFAVTMPFPLDDLRDVRLEPVSGGNGPLVATTSPT